MKVGEEDFGNIYEIEQELKRKLITAEPYCGLFDECYASDFSAEECRPAACPFSQSACSYLTACFDEAVQKEYAVALGLIKEGEEFPPTKKEPEAAEVATGKEKGGWGFFA